jgi:predicted RND superfamily exporter protein
LKLSRFTKLIIRNAYLVTAIGLSLAVVGTYFSIQLYKNLRTDIEELLPSHSRSGEDLAVLTGRLESIDYLAVLVMSKDSEASKRFVVDLAEKLKTIPKDISSSIEYRINEEMHFFQKRAPLYVELPDLVDLRNYIRDRVKYEKEMYNPINIFPVGDKVKKPELDLDKLREKYQRNGSYDQYPEGFYSTPDGTKRVILVYMEGKHSNIHKAHELSGWVTKIVGTMDTKAYAPDLEVRYTGGVQNFIEEHGALIKDLTLSTIIVVVLVTLLMFFFYRNVAGTASLVISLFMGTLWTFGVSYFAVGYLNANSAFLGSIVIGNGINFGIIFLARYIEERRSHKGLFRSIDIGIRSTATATWTAALAAGLSYGSLMLTRFRGFRQFGVIGLIGMILCWISAFTVLPALLSLIGRSFKSKPKETKQHAEGAISNGLASLVSKRPGTICAVSLAFTIMALAMFPRIDSKIIQTDLSKLRNKESMLHGAGFLDRYLVDIFQHYLTETVILADNREDANKIAAKLRERMKHPPATDIAVVKVFDDFIPAQQEEKFPLIRDIKKELTPKVVASLDPKEQKWVRDFLSEEALKPVTEADLPALVKTKFTEKGGELGRFVVVEPPLDRKNDIAWDGKRLITFIRELREIADSVRPGTPVAGQLPISADMVESISYDGPRATLFAFIAVVVLVIVLFRDIKTITRVLFALVLGVVWMFGLMLGFDLKINFLNFIALPITFGIGVDYGVNIFQRYRMEGSGKILSVIRNTGGAVMMASLTTIIGYSSLIIAENQAFVSFGTLAVLGEVTTLLAAVISLPAYLVWRSRSTSAKKKEKSSGPDSSERAGSFESSSLAARPPSDD